MLYILKNKDKDVLKFEVQIETQSFKGQSFNNTYFKDALIVDANLLPMQIRTDNLLASLESFIKIEKYLKTDNLLKKSLQRIVKVAKRCLWTILTFLLAYH